MKCPKCAYVGFEPTDQCRLCGYDFSLLTTASLAEVRPESPGPSAVRAYTPGSRADRAAPADDMRVEAASEDALRDLPLREATFPVLVHETQPPPARTPLAVRRTAADRPRTRGAPLVVRRSSAPLLDVAADPVEGEDSTPVVHVAPSGLRLVAAVIDLLVLAGIDLAVIYLTTRLAGVPVAEAVTLPIVPLGAFLLGLNVAYLAVFTANGGQTLGKMATGLRVVALSGELTSGGALVRVGAALAGTAAAGGGFLPALVRTDGRSLHDFAARTRVVRLGS